MNGTLKEIDTYECLQFTPGKRAICGRGDSNEQKALAQPQGEHGGAWPPIRIETGREIPPKPVVGGGGSIRSRKAHQMLKCPQLWNPGYATAKEGE